SSTGAKHKSEGTTHVGKRLVTVAAVAILETCKNCRLDGRLKMKRRYVVINCRCVHEKFLHLDQNGFR
ncbi:MAG: hypothetical protein WBE68_11395, partial [Candidatus Nitrosopolaris sp.]